MKNIIILGDSFTYGEGCSDRPSEFIKHETKGPSEKCWPSLLQKELPEYNILNLSVPGNSLSGCFVDLVRFKENVPQISIDMVIIAVTSHQRMILSTPHNPDELMSWVIGAPPVRGEFPEYILAKEYFVKYLLNDDIILHNGLQQLMAINYYCHHVCHAPILWSISNAHLILRHKKGNWTSLHDNYFNHMHNGEYYVKEKVTPEFIRQYTCEDGHPNDLGHEHYFSTYIRPHVFPKIHQLINTFGKGTAHDNMD